MECHAIQAHLSRPGPWAIRCQPDDRRREIRRTTLAARVSIHLKELKRDMIGGGDHEQSAGVVACGFQPDRGRVALTLNDRVRMNLQICRNTAPCRKDY